MAKKNNKGTSKKSDAGKKGSVKGASDKKIHRNTDSTGPRITSDPPKGNKKKN